MEGFLQKLREHEAVDPEGYQGLSYILSPTNDFNFVLCNMTNTEDFYDSWIVADLLFEKIYANGQSWKSRQSGKKLLSSLEGVQHENVWTKDITGETVFRGKTVLNPLKSGERSCVRSTTQSTLVKTAHFRHFLASCKTDVAANISRGLFFCFDVMNEWCSDKIRKEMGVLRDENAALAGDKLRLQQKVTEKTTQLQEKSRQLEKKTRRLKEKTSQLQRAQDHNYAVLFNTETGDII